MDEGNRDIDVHRDCRSHNQHLHSRAITNLSLGKPAAGPSTKFEHPLVSPSQSCSGDACANTHTYFEMQQPKWSKDLDRRVSFLCALATWWALSFIIALIPFIPPKFTAYTPWALDLKHALWLNQ